MIWKKFLLTVLILSFFISPIQAAEVRYFTTDYDNSIYHTESVEINIPEIVPHNWYPLRQMADVMSFQVEWDALNKRILIHHEATYGKWNTYMYTMDEIKKSNHLMIYNGTTYCSPDFLYILINGRGFLYDDVIYYYAGESVQAMQIVDEGYECFRDYVNTSMYELYLKYPQCYEYVRKYIDGSIRKSTKVREGKWLNVLGYTYPYLDEGYCFILADIKGARLTGTIVHEATHVYQVRTGLPTTEDLPREYGGTIYKLLLESNKI